MSLIIRNGAATLADPTRHRHPANQSAGARHYFDQSAGKTQQSLDILYRLQGSRMMDAVTPVA
jgi:hypothetical protein